MSFPYSAEGRIEIPIDSPEKVRSVRAGIEQWLMKSKACDVRWEGRSVQFSGDFGIARTRFNPLQGIGGCEIQFEELPDRLRMDYSVSFLPFPYLLIGVGLFLATAVSGIGDPRRLLLLPVIVLLAYAVWVMAGFGFQSQLRLAATRGLADGAEREWQALRPQHVK